jgi:hypothetical protein
MKTFTCVCECNGPFHSLMSNEKWRKHHGSEVFVVNIFCPWAWKDILTGYRKITRVDFPVMVLGYPHATP